MGWGPTFYVNSPKSVTFSHNHKPHLYVTVIYLISLILHYHLFIIHSFIHSFIHSPANQKQGGATLVPLFLYPKWHVTLWSTQVSLALKNVLFVDLSPFLLHFTMPPILAISFHIEFSVPGPSAYVTHRCSPLFSLDPRLTAYFPAGALQPLN